MKNLINVPAFSVDEVAEITFGGFGLDRFMASENKIPLWGKTLPQAMINCADKGRGCHLLTAFEWAALAYQWKEAKTLDDLGFDLHAETWQWIMGLFMEPDGTVDVLGSLDVTYQGSPYGRGTVTGSEGKTPTLRCDGQGKSWLKKWATRSFDGMKLYIAESTDDGEFFPIIETTENSLILPAGVKLENGTATFCIVRHIDTDVTLGMDSGDRIATLRNTDSDLKAFAIPAASSKRATLSLGNDRFWFYKDLSLRAARRGGNFVNAGNAGAFALNVYYAPSNSSYAIGFRAAKAL
jgi:hypothetical protein